MVGKMKKLEIIYHKIESATSICQALRDMNDSHVELKSDFILMLGDIICNADLKGAIDQHLAAKKRDKEIDIIMTKVFA